MAVIDFDKLASDSEVWELAHESGWFYLTFDDGQLKLTHEENRSQDVHRVELTDARIDGLLDVLLQYRAWQRRNP